MTSHEHTLSIDSDTSIIQDDRLLLDSQLAFEVRKKWELGDYSCLSTVLEKHPQIKRHRSFVLDLAYEEYVRRRANGESINAEDFSQQYPSFQKSLYFLIEVHKIFDNNPSLCPYEDSITWPKPGEKYLGYFLLSELGRGTFARVFLAREHSLGERLVAIKISFKGNHEAEMLGKLQHPNIVPVYSIQEDEETGMTAICMPYLGRTTLCDVIDNAFQNKAIPEFSFPILEIVRQQNNDDASTDFSSWDSILTKGTYVESVIHLIKQLAEALDYTHSCGVYHGDIKPSNVLLSSTGKPLLMDFNLSVNATINSAKIGGTLPYMAPEQLSCLLHSCQDNPIPIDSRTDIYSLGVIFYHLLSGNLPFMAKQLDAPIEEIANQLIEAQSKGPLPLHTCNTRVNRRLEKLVNDCLAYDPAQRPKSAKILVHALAKELHLYRRFARWMGSHRWQTSMMALCFVILVISIASFYVFRDPYSVQQSKYGIQLYNQGKYELAIQSLGNSLSSDPTQPNVLLARGKAHLKLQDYHLALYDFQTSYKLSPSLDAIAGRGFCLSKLKYHKEAIACYKDAIKKGFKTANILNNLGYIFYQTGKYDEAIEPLEEACAMDDTLQSSHLLLVIIYNNNGLNGLPVSDSALNHAYKAMKNGSPSKDLYYAVALMYAICAKNDKSLISSSLDCMEKAIDGGMSFNPIISNKVFDTIRQDQRFQKLSSRPRNTTFYPPAIFLLDPLATR